MKSNLAVLSSDNKTIKFIKNNNLEDLCNLYANSSRNTDDAKLFSENYGFEKYYGSYEDLIEDSNIEYIVNFLPTGIKFEYTYLALKKNKKIISNYPIISNKNELEGYQELKDLELMPNLFLIDDKNFKNFYNDSKNKKFVSYLLTFKQDQYNNLSSQDILFDLTPDLFFYIDQHKQLKPSFKSLIIKTDKITKKISFLSCVIDFEKEKILQIILDNGDPKNSHYCEYYSSNSIILEDLVNKDELFKFIQKKPFDNRTDFQYYPFKLFQEVLINE
tara:strand:+ start:1072 stop:1896 length:825 start_codon:yes stop_codon:yes gene_type:complete